MIKNLEVIKQQLSELASVINAFKSESVQLRIVELILQGTSIFSEEYSPNDGAAKKRRQGKGRNRKGTKKTKTTKSQTEPKKGAKISKMGPATTLNQLIEEGYFNEKYTINEIINHCNLKKARKFKSNELSSPLARFVRDGRLKRDKNDEGQFVYHK